jgi:hypothetical protein
LAGDIRDDLEVLVEVQHCQPGQFGRGGVTTSSNRLWDRPDDPTGRAYGPRAGG